MTTRQVQGANRAAERPRLWQARADQAQEGGMNVSHLPLVRNWRSDRKNTRRGYVDLEYPHFGLTIRNVAIHRRGETAWLAMPAREFIVDGQRRFSAVVVFDETANAALQSQVVGQLRTQVPELSEVGDD